DSGPEVETLFMPSDFDKDTLMKTDTALLAFAEYKLREGKAYDYLAALREGLGRKAATIQQKDQHAHGTRNNIAAQAEVQAEVVNVREFAKQYNANYGKLVALRLLLQGTDFAVPLTDALRVINMKADLKPSSLQSARTLGDSQNTDSWIFNVAPPQASGSKETDRVRWTRSWANMCRTNEEVNLLYAEARACRRGLEFAGALRDKTSEAPPEYASPGATAYAHQKADMFRSM
ncbi:hypothetical protein C8Q76DRAFT_575368, partial [Earliella scabrosa]